MKYCSKLLKSFMRKLNIDSDHKFMGVDKLDDYRIENRLA